MAFDGITVAALRKELDDRLAGGKINKIAQPETDALQLTVKNNRTNYRLFISSSPSLPLVYFTEVNRPSPLSAPNFCMLLRKHIGSGKILHVTQPGLERVLIFEIEHLDELGDLRHKKLIVELMGKHSNIIFCDEENKILDSIKHVSANISSVREVLPGRTWFIPDTQQKHDPLTAEGKDFVSVIPSRAVPLGKAIYQSYTGISPTLSEELCYRAGLDSSRPAGSFSADELMQLYLQMVLFFRTLEGGEFQHRIYYKGKEPKDFTCFAYRIFADMDQVEFPTISQVLEKYYAEKEAVSRIHQKSADLRRIITTSLERNQRKLQLQEKQMKDTEKKDKYRIYGEMIHTYGYSVPEHAKSFTCLNYYTNEDMTVPLDSQLSAADNAKKYYDRYSKLKRTAEALLVHLEETKDEIETLDSINTALDIAVSESDLTQIRQELVSYGYIKKKGNGNKRERITSKPFHYRSSDGFDIYVGKNNFQNDELTFKFATGNDWWFHAKGQPGSHVVVKNGNDELPDRTFEEAAALAAYYSKGRQAPKVEIDYIQKKHVKKTNGGKPGFVIYHTNYSMVAVPDISDIELISN